MGSIISLQGGAEEDIKARLKKPGQHLQIYSCSGDPKYTPNRPNAEHTRAMSSPCSSMAQSAGA